jgi:NAD(P)-dependent dehydrogenase (short-subunit alcohol dehydrogenase family)
MSGRVYVVTGATAGVGRAVVERLADRGERVALLARGKEGLEATDEDVRRRGGTSVALSVDTSDADAVDRAAHQTERELGPIDVWINDALSSVFSRVWETNAGEIKRVTEVAYLGYVNGTLSALKRMRPRDRGTIVQVGSALAYRGIPGQAAYCGAKHAIQGFNESLRCELLATKSHVRTTMVQLPALNTPQFGWVLSRFQRRPQPVPPIYQPEVAAQAIVFAADHPSRREYWVGGSTTMTLVANALAPGLLDRYLAITGLKSQQTGQPPDPNRPDNLWQPVDEEPRGGDHGSHGAFDERANARSYQVWLSQHHGLVYGGIAAAVGAVASSRAFATDP